jgi:sugar phosphate permease
MFSLIFAGEAIFFLPFVLARLFRPTLLDLFGLSNLELGMAFAIYGVLAMLAYFPGGPLADRFPPRVLMTLALIATSLGGLVMSWIPTLSSLKLLYGYWGVTTILLFWAPLIRATRQWAGNRLPGRAFGLLDGGRGLVAAAVGSFTVLLYDSLLPEDVAAATRLQRTEALRQVILVFTGVTGVTGLLVWFGLSGDAVHREQQRERFHARQVLHVVAMPTVWLQSMIVVCAYVGYKGLDDLSLYANQVLGYDEVAAARVTAWTLWMRPVAAVGAGLIADRWGVTRMTAICFALLGLSSAAMAGGIFRPGMSFAFFLTVLTASATLFALRGLYFAIMEEGRVPFGLTGTAVGLVSVIGYTPDVFMGPLMGYLIDRTPDASGHYHVFAVIGGFAVLGFVTTLLFWAVTHRQLRVLKQAGSPQSE